MNMDLINSKKSPFAKPLKPATVEVCRAWLRHFPGILPKHEQPQAFSVLTNETVPDLEDWFASPMQHAKPQVVPPAGLYHQHQLPSNFPPQVNVAVAAQPAHNTANQWQHHHYFSASSQANFPQSQDRYICPTCNKAFSRPGVRISIQGRR